MIKWNTKIIHHNNSKLKAVILTTKFPMTTVAKKNGIQDQSPTSIQSHMDSIHSPHNTRNTIINECMKSVKFHLGISLSGKRSTLSAKEKPQFNALLSPFFSHSSVAQHGPWPPHSWGFYINHNNTPQSVGLLWMSDQWCKDLYPTTHNTCNRKTSMPPAGLEPRSQQVSSCRPIPYIMWPLGPAICHMQI